MDIFSYLRHCAFCKRGLFSKIDLFCESCWQKLLLQKRSNLALPIFVKKTKVFPLFLWSGKNPLLETLLYALKAGGVTAAFDRIACESVLGRADLYRSMYARSRVFVPIPSSVKNKNDHAHQLAAAFARRLESEIQDPLYWPDKHLPQKLLDQQARSHLVMMREKPLELQRKTKIIIVDDVVTTGSTVQTALAAIQSPNPREVWCIAYRI